MIDFHSHILPNMDDGAEDIDTSCEMLSMMKKQNVRGVVATSHFYPTEESPRSFLHRRKEVLAELAEKYDENKYPTVYIGAEVAYYAGIASSEQLPQLCILGTPIILIEMPFMQWSESVLEELYAIRENRRLVPVVAHIERYIDKQKRGTLKKMLEHNILIQSNAEHFVDKHSQKDAIKMLENREIHLLGTDTHNCESRPPDLWQAAEIILEKTDGHSLAVVNAFTKRILQHATTFTQFMQN